MAAVKVKILGKDYWLGPADQEEERLQHIASLLDERLKEVINSSNLPALSATVLVALNLTNELLQLQESQEQLMQVVEKNFNQVLLSFE